MKNNLFNSIKNDANERLMVKAVRGLKVYKQYRMDKVATTHLMTKAVQAVVQKKFITLWKQRLLSNTGAKLLDFIFIRMRQRQFVQRLAKRQLFEEEATRHLKLVNLFKLVETAFYCLKKSVVIKHRNQHNTASI